MYLAQSGHSRILFPYPWHTTPVRGTRHDFAVLAQRVRKFAPLQLRGGNPMARSNQRGQRGLRGPRGLRGERGIPGPPGPRGQAGEQGAPGKIGKTGARGLRGAIGPRGAAGARGPTGLSGAPGIAGDDLNALAAVHDQIDHIHHELDVQLKRMAQLQIEIDEVRNTVKRLLGS